MSKLDELRRLRELKLRARSSVVEQRLLKSQVAGSMPAASAKRTAGRPLAKDAHTALMRTKPWEKQGMSRSTWYRRQKAKGK